MKNIIKNITTITHTATGAHAQQPIQNTGLSVTAIT